MIRYQLSDLAASKRARTAALARALASLAPIALTVVVVHRLALVAPPVFWAIALAVTTLVVVRAATGYGGTRRRLRALVVTVSDDAVTAENRTDARTVARERVARVLEVPGALGGLRVESTRDPETGEIARLDVPSGGEGWPELREALGRWRAIDRRRRGGVALRVATGVAVLAGLFFLPFLFEDFVARSRLASGAVVLGGWIAVRVAMRVS